VRLRSLRREEHRRPVLQRDFRSEDSGYRRNVGAHRPRPPGVDSERASVRDGRAFRLKLAIYRLCKTAAVWSRSLPRRDEPVGAVELGIQAR
jgi:hypothetical protein